MSTPRPNPPSALFLVSFIKDEKLRNSVYWAWRGEKLQARAIQYVLVVEKENVDEQDHDDHYGDMIFKWA